MKNSPLLILLFLGLALNSWGYNLSDTISTVLRKVEEKNKEIKTISYQSSYKQIYSGKQDSIYIVDANIWLQKKPADTIFNSIFHVKGMDNKENYDCYYDGQKFYEIRHLKKKVTIINPYNFPNDSNNPAKARTALLPILPYLISTELINTLLKGINQKELVENANEWIIKLQYDKDNYGMVKTAWITISKKDLMLSSYNEQILWNGIHINSFFTISNISINQPSIAYQIPLSSSFNTYDIINYEASKEKSPKSGLIGKAASNFKYVSYNGNTINLLDFKGKYVLLDFWESWCGNCILELPEIKELNNRYKRKGLCILGISTDNKTQIATLIKKNNLSYINLIADHKIVSNYNVIARPTYVLINPSGIIIQYSSNLDEIKSVLFNTIL